MGREHRTSSPLDKREDNLSFLDPRPLSGSAALETDLHAVHPHLQAPLGVDSRKRLGAVGGGACLRLMDGAEEMSGTFFPLGEVKL